MKRLEMIRLAKRLAWCVGYDLATLRRWRKRGRPYDIGEARCFGSYCASKFALRMILQGRRLRRAELRLIGVEFADTYRIHMEEPVL